MSSRPECEICCQRITMGGCSCGEPYFGNLELHGREIKVGDSVFDKENNFEFVVSENWALSSVLKNPDRFSWPD